MLKCCCSVEAATNSLWQKRSEFPRPLAGEVWGEGRSQRHFPSPNLSRERGASGEGSSSTLTTGLLIKPTNYAASEVSLLVFL